MGYNLIIIESSKMISFGLKDELLKQSNNLNIFQAHSGKEAKEIILKNDIHFILTSLVLPDCEGDKVIKELNELKKAKVIVLTSNDDTRNREELFKLGILDYFSKNNPIKFIVSETIKLITKYNNNRDITILVVDDSRIIRAYIKFIFENRNYRVITAEDGKVAIEKLKIEKIDIILLDLDMPIMNGEDTIYHIRTKDDFLDLPIIIFSTTRDQNLISKLLKNGANEFIHKPVLIETIILKTEMLIAVSHAQKEIKIKNKKITDSINFSSMIQNSIMPKEFVINNNIPKNFIMWEPKDIVGGDIYLFEDIGKTPYDFGDGFLMFIIDCTGHGVPGAFMTMITKTAISNIISKNNYNNPALILFELNQKIKTTLNQNSSDTASNAGLDGAVLYFDREDKKITFASANTPLFYIENGDLKVIKGDRESIGYKDSNINFEFKNYEINLDSQKYFYITTDGFIDQNGGSKSFPFGKKRVKNLIIENYTKEFSEQKKIFLNALKEYQAKEERNDDITMIGFSL